MDQELPKEEAERRAKEIARRMLTTPKKPAGSQKRQGESRKKPRTRRAAASHSA